ncbi:transporter substrate-binding domain-containing protein [Desulfobacterales bacterium HSG16]|nr:transporter substrate-binding domain-containing protein [Desulfobacterales bacterium HSG16]
MMKSRSIAGIVFFAFTLMLCQTATSSAYTVKLGYIEFPPLFSTDENGKSAGILIDLADKVLTRAGYQWQAESFPTKRMIQKLIDGEIHLWIGLSTIPAFENTTYIGKSKIMEISLRAYSLGKKPLIGKKEDLNGKSLLIMRGYSYGGLIKYIEDRANGVNYTKTDNHVAGFKMLQAGHADYFLDYRMPSETALKEVKIPDLTYSEISSFAVYFVVSQKAPDAKKLLEDLENAYKNMRKAE